MLQVIEQSTEEKMAMYLKLSKKELAIMLISCNDNLEIAIKNCNLPIASGSLPTDKEISDFADNIKVPIGLDYLSHDTGVVTGAEWMRSKLVGNDR